MLTVVLGVLSHHISLRRQSKILRVIGQPLFLRPIQTHSFYLHYRSYCMQWMPLLYENCTKMREFEYKSANDRKASSMSADYGVYTGGGYELQLRGHIDALNERIQTLKDNNWIDNRTRALITEFSVYNAQVNMFGVVKIIGEFVGGGVLPFYRVDVLTLTRQWNFAGYVVFACEVIFILSTLYYIINSLGILKELGAREFFKAAWNVVDVFTILLSLLAIGLWVIKTLVVLELTKQIGEKKGNEYVSIEAAQSWNNKLELAVAFTVFTSLLKLCRLLRYPVLIQHLHKKTQQLKIKTKLG